MVVMNTSQDLKTKFNKKIETLKRIQVDMEMETFEQAPKNFKILSGNTLKPSLHLLGKLKRNNYRRKEEGEIIVLILKKL